MNGQTGRLIGDLPVGKDLAVKYWFKCHIPLTIAMTAIVYSTAIYGGDLNEENESYLKRITACDEPWCAFTGCGVCRC